MPAFQAWPGCANDLHTVGDQGNINRTGTNDAFYRETKAKIKLRKEQGCGCVEMEAAALFFGPIASNVMVWHRAKRGCQNPHGENSKSFILSRRHRGFFTAKK